MIVFNEAGDLVDVPATFPVNDLTRSPVLSTMNVTGLSIAAIIPSRAGVPRIARLNPSALTGLQGPKGDTGDQGPIGLAGASGAVGPKGDTGLTGTTGSIGPKGDAGAAGPAGATGATGNTGAQGAVGPTGPSGLTGATGSTGSAGSNASATPLSSTMPADPGVAAIGVSTSAARADHVHNLPTGRLTQVATGSAGETLTVAATLGVKRYAMAAAGVVMTDRIVPALTGAPVNGTLQDAYVSSNGTISVGLLVPVLGIGATVAVPIALYKVT